MDQDKVLDEDAELIEIERQSDKLVPFYSLQPGNALQKTGALSERKHAL